jgi:hypothetical protein
MAVRKETLVLLCCGWLLINTGCKQQTVEYRSRPAWQSALTGNLPKEHVRSDGTIMKFQSGDNQCSALQEYLDTIELEEVDELTGKKTLRAIFPKHVLTHTLTCLRDRTWDLLFEQLVSSEMQEFYNQKENGREEFEVFFSSNRREIAKTLQRILGGSGFGDVTISRNEHEIIHTLSDRVGRDYTFKRVSFVREGEFLRLHSIR